MADFTKTNCPDNMPYVLPSSNKDLQRFIEKYKVDMTEQVISSIEFAVKHKLPLVEIFQFKDSKFVVAIYPKQFEENLENIYNFYLTSERYELCERVARLRDKLKNPPNEKSKKPKKPTAENQ